MLRSAMNPRFFLSRRAAFTRLSAAGAVVAGLHATRAADAASSPAARRPAPRSGSAWQLIAERVNRTPLVDTHEHLIEEPDRLRGAGQPGIPCDDWALLFSHYLDSDLLTSGMPRSELDRFLSPEVDPVAKWTLLAPYWRLVKHTGYAQAVRLAIRELYGVDDLSEATIPAVQAGYERTRCVGFYERVLRDRANIESCQVNCITGGPFQESALPTLLMQDLSIVGMFAGPSLGQYAPPTGIEVKDLSDWHRVIDWWFEKHAQYAVAVKSQHGYSRDIDYVRVPAEQAAPVFRRVLGKEPVSPEERKLMQDHLFWYAVDQATRRGLPVKLHTGYYAGQNSMPLGRLTRNAASAGELCRLSPDTQFVFMHICYPFYEDLLSVAKHWSNASVDMCWAWIINPIAAVDYVKKHLVTAPVNKLLPFGGDYIPVEPVLGHAIVARRGLARALGELVGEGWLTLSEALDLVDPILRGNARRLFQLDKKTEVLRQAPWLKSNELARP